MPYIKQNVRVRIDWIMSNLYAEITTYGVKGVLNYFLFKLAKRTCKSYGDYSRFIAELECAKLEIYRRLVAPYEDKKIEENGDVE